MVDCARMRACRLTQQISSSPQDPFFQATTEDELEDIGENLGGIAPNLARQYMVGGWVVGGTLDAHPTPSSPHTHTRFRTPCAGAKDCRWRRSW